MAKKAFQCSKCGRTFSMAAHLARHTNSAHASKRKKARRPKRKIKKRTPRAKTRRKVARTAARGTAATAIRELRAYHRQLSARRDALDTEITGIESAMAAMGAGTRRRRGRPRRR
jgi:uncharacterized C2H2 Zn-finger protein